MGCVSASPGATRSTNESRFERPRRSACGRRRNADPRRRFTFAARARVVGPPAERIGRAGCSSLVDQSPFAGRLGRRNRALVSLAGLARDPRPAVRGAALEALSRRAGEPACNRRCRATRHSVRIVVPVLESDEAATPIRAVALEALERLLVLKPEINWAVELLIAQMISAATRAERMAAAAARAKLPASSRRCSATALTDLPLDEPPAREVVYVRARSPARSYCGRASFTVSARSLNRGPPVSSRRNRTAGPDAKPGERAAAARRRGAKRPLRTDRQCVARESGGWATTGPRRC